MKQLIITSVCLFLTIFCIIVGTLLIKDDFIAAGSMAFVFGLWGCFIVVFNLPVFRNYLYYRNKPSENPNTNIGSVVKHKITFESIKDKNEFVAKLMGNMMIHNTVMFLEFNTNYNYFILGYRKEHHVDVPRLVALYEPTPVAIEQLMHSSEI